MKLCYVVKVPGTEHLRYEAPRRAGWTGPISKDEKIDAAANPPPLVAAIRDLYNDNLPAEADPQKYAATIEVHPIYDAADAILDTLAHMDDADLLAVPEAAVQNAPGITQQMRDGYYARLASIAEKKAAQAAARELARVKATLPAPAQGQIPAQVNLTVDSGA